MKIYKIIELNGVGNFKYRFNFDPKDRYVVEFNTPAGVLHIIIGTPTEKKLYLAKWYFNECMNLEEVDINDITWLHPHFPKQIKSLIK